MDKIKNFLNRIGGKKPAPIDHPEAEAAKELNAYAKELAEQGKRTNGADMWALFSFDMLPYDRIQGREHGDAACTLFVGPSLQWHKDYGADGVDADALYDRWMKVWKPFVKKMEIKAKQLQSKYPGLYVEEDNDEGDDCFGMVAYIVER